MTDATGLRRDWRAIHWSVWLFLALTVLYLVVRYLSPSFALLSALAGASPLLFCAAVAFVRPADRRLRWAAWAIAISVLLPYLNQYVPEFVFDNAPGDWSNAAFLLQDLQAPIRDVNNVLFVIGVVLVGLGLGGVRSAFGAAVFALGAVVGLAYLVWFVAHPIEQLGLFEIARSVAISTLTSLAWSFLFASAVDSVRGLLIVGTGLLFANVIVNAVLLWWSPGPDANFVVLSFGIAGLGLAGWLVTAAGVLRGELTAPTANARSRAARRSALRPGAG